MKAYRFLSLLLCAVLAVSVLVACENTPDNPENTDAPDVTDYAASVTPDTGSATVRCDVTVKTFIDGDTTHFNVPAEISSNGVLKGRYLAINTPESTGKIEEYGKAAAKFTREKLESASAIMIESDDGIWNLDSTGGRYLVWVWYKTSADAPYRNLNIEILQNGLAIASSAANNRYGQTAVAAIDAAKTQKLNLHSGAPDPDFFYGDAVELTLKELRCDIEAYNGVKVAFEGVITMNEDNSVYVEDYDAESGMYFGITAYYGYALSGEGLEILAVGNRSRIVGTVQYYEAGGTYQVSGLSYRQMKPDDPNNLKKISDGHSPAYVQYRAGELVSGEITLENSDGDEKVFDYSELIMSTSVSVGGLEVLEAYTTAEGSSKGAFTLICSDGGVNISVRTAPLYDDNGELIKADGYIGKTISVMGVMDYYNGEYQIKVLSEENIKVN